MRTCINSRGQLKVHVQRLTDEQVAALTRPDSGGSEEINKSQNVDSSLRPYVCDVSGCTYAGRLSSSLYHHKRNVHLSNLYTCHLCGKKMKILTNFNMHVSKHETETPGTFKCVHQNCRKLFEDIDELKKHTKMAHDLVKPFQCNVCGKCFGNKSALNIHAIRHKSERPFKCGFEGCPYTAKFKVDIKVHIRNMHTTINMVSCCYCEKSYKSNVCYQRHLLQHKTDTPGVFKCLRHHCNETFTDTQQLRVHALDSHDEVPNFPCKRCGRIYPGGMKLKTHMMLKHQIVSCPVSDCWYTCVTSEEMQSHETAEHAEVFLKCSICGTEYHSEALFKIHMIKHKTERRELVKKTLTGQLVPTKTHEKNHGGLIVCDIAGSEVKSTWKRDLVMHKASAHLKTPGLDTNNLVISSQLKTNSSNSTTTKDVMPVVSELCKISQKVRVLKVQETDTPGVFKCTLEQTSAVANPIMEQVAKSYQRTFTCDFPGCDYSSQKQYALLNHKRKLHTVDVWKCNLCSMQFVNSQYGMRHVENVHKNQQSAEHPKLASHKPDITEQQKVLAGKIEIDEVILD